MYWFACVYPSAQIAIPTIVFDETNQPAGHALFSSEDLLHKRLGACTQLEYQTFQIGGDVKLDVYIHAVADFYTKVRHDWEEGFKAALLETPVFIDPHSLTLRSEMEPDYDNLIVLIYDRLKNCYMESLKLIGFTHHKDYTIAVIEQNTGEYAALAKLGLYPTPDDMEQATARILMTEIHPTRELALEQCKSLVDSQ